MKETKLQIFSQHKAKVEYMNVTLLLCLEILIYIGGMQAPKVMCSTEVIIMVKEQR